MNIFVTNSDPRISAKNLDDKRVIKMINESVQLLVTALHHHGTPLDNLPVKPTHKNHPAAVWVRSTRQNYSWLLRHTVSLMHEKRKRYPENKPHQYEQHVKFLRDNRKLLPSFKLTNFVNCAANESLGISYKHISDVTMAYQLYLNDRWDTDKRPATWYRVER